MLFPDSGHFFTRLAYANGKPLIKAQYKTMPEMFTVCEHLSFTPQGQGSHVFLWIEKQGLNTQEVIQRLCRFCGVKPVDIGYAGLKDKRAITQQYFSVNVQNLNEPDWSLFSRPDCRIIDYTYHPRKLKTGTVKHNTFTIVLQIQYFDSTEFFSRLEQIKKNGIPNYFGLQRFGIEENNLQRAAQWLTGKIRIKSRAQKSLLLSAARSYLFNQMLSVRIQEFGWHKLIAGEVFQLQDSHSVFATSVLDKSLQQRFIHGDIHPTLALWGKGDLLSQADLLAFEQRQAQVFMPLAYVLENKGLKQARRSLRVIPQDLCVQHLDQHRLSLSFSLPGGAYATSVLRELVDLEL